MQDSKVVDQQHIVVPALALAIPLWYRLLGLAKRSRGAIGIFSRVLLMLSVACLRVEYTQDIMRLAVSNRAITVHCNKGTRREGGRRPTFDFGIPRILEPGFDVDEPVVHLWDQLEGVSSRPVTYMFPDLRVQRWECVTERSQWWPNPWRQKRMREATLKHIGATDEVWEHKGATCRWRRFLSSVAGGLNFEQKCLQLIGTWQNIPGTNAKSSLK